MRGAALLLVSTTAVALAFGCELNTSSQPTPATPPGQQSQPYSPPPPQQPYYPPQQGPQQPYSPPPPAPPAPTQPAPPASQPPPGPTASSSPQQPYNPWATLLHDLLKGGAPPLPSTFPWPLPLPAPTQPQPAPPAVATRGLELASAINQYRAQNGLPPIPISKSLAKVADSHVHDLQTAPRMGAQCNDHSWTARGSWTPCCYTADHAQAKCMWYKPSEITGFKGSGFEIAIGQPGDVKVGLVLDAKQAIQFWQSSPVHNDVILNRGQWQSMTWRAMGAGLVDSHASAWFSDQSDPTP